MNCTNKVLNVKNVPKCNHVECWKSYFSNNPIKLQANKMALAKFGAEVMAMSFGDKYVKQLKKVLGQK